MMNKNSKIFIAGASGLVGSAILRALAQAGFTENILTPTHAELDLLDPLAVDKYFNSNKPEFVFLAAAKVGGIYANNTYPADFIMQNLKMELNIIESSHKYQIKKMMFFGAACVYPKLAQQPMRESEFLNGYIEPTNIAYAVAKIAGIVACQSYNKQFGTHFISVMPANLYGKNDNYNLEYSHVIPSMIRKFHQAKINNKSEVELWGTGMPQREFLYVDDMAEACIFLMKNYDDGELINIGSNQEINMRQLAEEIKKTVGYHGNLKFDVSKPDGSPRKALDSTKILSMGWRPKIGLAEGLKLAYEDFLGKGLL